MLSIAAAESESITASRKGCFSYKYKVALVM